MAWARTMLELPASSFMGGGLSWRLSLRLLTAAPRGATPVAAPCGVKLRFLGSPEQFRPNLPVIAGLCPGDPCLRMHSARADRRMPVTSTGMTDREVTPPA